MGKKLTNTVELKGQLDASVNNMFKAVQKMSEATAKAMKNYNKETSKSGAKPFEDAAKAAKQSGATMSVLGSKLNAINDGLQMKPTSLNLITSKQQTLGKMIDTTKTKLAALQQQQQEFIDSGGDLGSDKYEKLQTEIQKTENSLSRLTAQQNNFSPRVQQFGAAMDVVSEKTGAMAKTFAPASAAAGAFGVSTVKTSMDFQSAMNQIAATKGISTTSEELGQLREQAMKLGADTAFSSTQAAEGLNILSMAGYGTEDAIAMSQSMLSLASAGQIDMADSAAYLATTMKGFQDQNYSAGDVADRIAKGSSLAATDVGQLGDAFSAASATSNAYGQSIDDMGVALLKLADQGVTGSAAGTALAAVEKNLFTATDQGAKAMQQLGVSAYTAEGKARPLNDVLNDIGKATKNMTDQQRSDVLSNIFDIQGMEAFNKMMATTSEKEKGFREGLENSSGAADQMAKTQNEGLKGSLIELGSAFDNAKISIGNVFSGPLEKGVDWLTGLVHKFNDAGDSVHKFTAYGIAGLAALSPALFGVSKLTGGIGSFISKAGKANTITRKLAGGIGKMFGKKTAGAGSRPLAGMTAGSDAQLNTMTAKAQACTSKIGSMFQGMGNGISTVFQGIGKGIQSVFTGISSMNLMGAASFAVVVGSVSLALIGLAKCRNDILPFLEGLNTAFTGLVSGVLDAFVNSLIKLAPVVGIVAEGFAKLAPLATALGSGIGQAAQGIGSGIGQIAQGVGQGIATILSAIGPMMPQIASSIAILVQAFAGAAPTIAGAITQIITAATPLVATLVPIFTTLITSISPILDSLGEAFSKFGEAVHSALEGVADIITAVGEAINNILSGAADVVRSIGDAALNCGTGFERMANGLEKITGLNLFSMGAALAAVAAGAGLLVGYSGGMSELGTGFMDTANAMQMLSGNISGAIAAMALLPPAIENLVSASANMSTIGDNMMPAALQMTVALNMMGTAASSNVPGIISPFMTVFPQIPTIVSTTMSNASNAMTSGLSGMKSAVTSAMNGVISAFQVGMAMALATVRAGISAIQSAMSVSISGPHLAVPHVSVSGNFSLNPPSAPSFSVSYFKKGGLLNGATLFGAMGEKALVGGEAGPEAILPLDTLWSKMDEILTKAVNTAISYASLGSRPINNENAIAKASAPASTGGNSPFNVTFAPVININGGQGEDVQGSVSTALARAKDDLMDELESLLAEMRDRAYA